MRRAVNYRMNRRDFFESRATARTVPRDELRKRVERQAKRYLKSKGVIGPKLPSTWQLDIGEQYPLVVVAHTRSEARALIKKELGVKTLPTGLKIKKVVYEPTIL